MHCVARLHNTLHNFFNNREINSITTTILIFISLYISIITLLGENFLNPLADHGPVTTSDDVTVRSIFIIFILLIAGIFAAKLSKLLKIPPLFGCLALGIVIRNITVFEQFFTIPPFLETMIRKVALVNIVIRWGLATDVRFLYENAVMPVTIGLVTAIGEIIAVTIASYFILNISFVMSIFCALILVTVSPAVTVPAMINFKEKNLGSLKRVPENVLAICCVDNLFCVVVFMVLSSIIFTDAPIATTILLNAGTIVFGIIGGGILGWVLWRFPRSDAPHTQFARITLLGAVSIALIIGTYLIKYSCSGFIAALILSAMCAMQWKSDNKDKLECVESTYKYVWDCFALPLLFICLGLKFDCSTLTWELVFLCIAVIAIGLLVRTILTMLVTLSSHINFKEQIVVSLSLLPRATFQADLAPTLLVMAAPFPAMAQEAALIMKAAILSVLVTAPIFDILLNLVGSKCLTAYDPQDSPVAEKNFAKSYINGEHVDETIYAARPKTYSEYRSETLVERY
uniref:Na_H_Exchanger domain-containing protein n=1 Tax=Caenorhabditis japonica TaxID=281687 RepID=A0A8R1HHW8_CAEJA